MLRLDWNLLFNIINLVILYLLMKRFLFKPINAILSQRQAEAGRQMAEAQAEKERAMESRKQYEASMQAAEQEKEKIVASARSEASEEYSRIVEEAKTKADGIIEKACADAEHEKTKMMQQAESEVRDMVVKAAARVAGDRDGEKNDRVLFDEFISKTGVSRRE